MDPETSGSVLSRNTVIGDSANYTTGGHKSSAHGIVFHEQYLLLCAYRSLASGKQFRMTCEVEEAGKFDDLVYFHEADGEVACVLVQYKHKESADEPLKLSALLSKMKSHRSFSLVEYFNSYLELSGFEDRYRCRIASCILVTNLGLDEEFVRSNLEDCTGEMRMFSSGVSYRFKATGRDRPMICRELERYARNVKDPNEIRARIDGFLKRFVFSVNNEGRVDRVEAEIKRELRECLRSRNAKVAEHPGRVDVIYKCLYNRIFVFHSSREARVATDSDCLEWLLDASEKMGEDMVPVYHEYNMNRLTGFGTDLFTGESVRYLSDFLEACEEDMFCVAGHDRTVFAVLKLVQVLRQAGTSFHVIVDDQFLLLLDEHVVVTAGEYLIVRCESRESWSSVLEKTRRIVVLNTGKKIALVTGFDCPVGLCGITDETRWSDLDGSARLRLDSKTVSFQGKKVPFSVLDVSGVERRIDERVLVDIFEEKLKISRRSDDGTPCYVDRRIGRRHRIDLERFRRAEHVFVVENMSRVEYERFVAVGRFDRSRFRLEERFDAFCTTRPNRSVSLVHHVDGKFYWKKSRGVSVEGSTDAGFDPVIDLDDVDCISDRTVLIVAEPGMGKSSLLSVLLRRSVERRPDVWIVKIDLGSRTERVYAMRERRESFSEDGAVEFVVDSQRFETSFESDLFRSYFRLAGKLVVLCDGFDEIAPDYRDVVLGLLVRLSSMPTVRVWVTSRPQEKDYLESGLGLLSYAMLEFSVDDRTSFFARRWAGGDGADRRARAFIDRLLGVAADSFGSPERLLAGIPLQCTILAEVYRSRFERFCASESAEPTLPDAFDILDVYERFVRGMFERHVVEKARLDPTSTANRRIVEVEARQLTKSHKLLGVDVVFARRFDAKLDEYKRRIVDGSERTGIVHSLDAAGRPVFVHRTFAEYFAALWFRDRLTAGGRDADLVRFLERSLLEPEHETFRRFFDRMSARSAPALRHVLNNDTDRLAREDSDLEILVDDFHRNALHLAASYKHVDMIGFLIRRGVRTDSRDGLFGWTPLTYGLGVGLAWSSIESLLPGNEADRTPYERIADADRVLLDASRDGLGGVVEYLLRHGARVDAEDALGRTPLHVAAAGGRARVCATLLERGAPVNREDWRGATPLHYACAGGRAAVVARLLARGADANALVCYKDTPLHYACERGDVDVVDAFVARDADALARVKHAETLLHAAVRSGSVALVATLIARGADVNARDYWNETPLDVASERDGDEIAELLLANGALI